MPFLMRSPAVGYAIVLDAMPLASEGRWGAVVLDLAVAGIIFGMVAFFVVALFKWLAVRRYAKTAVPMWTPFVWLSEAATNMYEGLAIPNFLRYLRGTPLAAAGHESYGQQGCRQRLAGYHGHHRA